MVGNTETKASFNLTEVAADMWRAIVDCPWSRRGRAFERIRGRRKNATGRLCWTLRKICSPKTSWNGAMTLASTAEQAQRSHNGDWRTHRLYG